MPQVLNTCQENHILAAISRRVTVLTQSEPCNSSVAFKCNQPRSAPTPTTNCPRRSAAGGSNGLNRSDFVLAGATAGRVTGGAYGSYTVMTAAMRMVAVETVEGLMGGIIAADALSNGNMAGFSVGGPWGAVAGGAIGLGAYGIHRVTQSDQSSCQQPTRSAPQ